MEPVEIFIDATEFMVLVFCGECSEFRQMHDTAQEARDAGRKHRAAWHKDRGINTITIRDE